MEIRIKRTESVWGATVGKVFVNDVFYCFSLELMWRDNARNISCIPVGEYDLIKRYTKARGSHLMVKDVPNRSYILIHTANTIYDLRGCIGLGMTFVADASNKIVKIGNSKKAVLDFTNLVLATIDKGEKVKLIIE